MPRGPADSAEVAQPSLAQRLAAQGVAVAAGTVGTMVLIGVALADAMRRRARPREHPASLVG